MQDEEANRGGVPSREAHWLSRLGWSEDSDELAAFYEAFAVINHLNQGRKVRVEDSNGNKVIHFI